MHDGINTSTSNNDAMHIETAKSYKNMIENGELTNIPWILTNQEYETHMGRN
jgi:hypothetical protein